MKDEMQIVEFFGGPGSGKTTLATYCFSQFKLAGIDCEFTREFAQEAIYRKSEHLLKHQSVISANQYRKYLEQKLAGTKLLFSDSSLLLAKIYGDSTSETVKNYFNELNDEFNIYKIFVRRAKKYSPQGRMQTEAEAKALDFEIKLKCGPFDYETEATAGYAESLVEHLHYLNIDKWKLGKRS